MAEGAVLSAFGVMGLTRALSSTGTAPSAGVAVLGLNIRLWQAALLLGFGMVLIVAASRRAAIIVTGLAAMAWLVLAIGCTDAAVRGVPGAMGFDLRDSLVYAALTAYNFGLYTWLSGDPPGDNVKMR